MSGHWNDRFVMPRRPLTARHTPMATAHACNAARTVAATHQVQSRAHRRMGAMLPFDVVVGGPWIVRAIAAGIEIDLGLGSAHGADGQRDCEK
jgi:hypothetical protein